jgi:hypothetical protein
VVDEVPIHFANFLYKLLGEISDLDSSLFKSPPTATSYVWVGIYAGTIELLEDLFGENAGMRNALGLQQTPVGMETDFAGAGKFRKLFPI